MTSDGLLPPGVHDSTWGEFVALFGTNPRRLELIAGLRSVCLALAVAGCVRLWVDGSFVTDKVSPGDYDACWDWQGVDQTKLDPLLLNYTHAGRIAMKAKYLGDVLIAGIEQGSGLAFVDFFQQTRDGTRKGIVLLNPMEVS